MGRGFSAGNLNLWSDARPIRDPAELEGISTGSSQALPSFVTVSQLDLRWGLCNTSSGNEPRRKPLAALPV